MSNFCVRLLYFTNIAKGTTDLRAECVCKRKGWVPEKIFSFRHSPNYLSTQKNTHLNAILRTKVTFEKLLPRKQRLLVFFLPRNLYKICRDYFVTWKPSTRLFFRKVLAITMPKWLEIDNIPISNRY